MRHFDISNVEWFKQIPINELVNKLLTVFVVNLTLHFLTIRQEMNLL